MNVDLATIWRVPVYLPYLQPELSDERIAEAESRIGFSLPADYLNLLRSQNGGYLRVNLPEVPHRMIYGIGPYFPSVNDFDWEDDREHVSMELDGLVPFDGDGHWHLCLDYRENRSSPCISYVDIELDSEHPIADTFSNYLQLLRWEVGDNEFLIPSVSDVESIKATLAKFLRIDFEEPTSWAHGYPVHRAPLAKPEDLQWIWISPNLVPRGFVRADDPRYNELRHLMPGTALRYPSLPEDSYIVSFADAARQRVLDAFHRASIELRAMKDLLGASNA